MLSSKPLVNQIITRKKLIIVRYFIKIIISKGREIAKKITFPLKVAGMHAFKKMYP